MVVGGGWWWWVVMNRLVGGRRLGRGIKGWMDKWIGKRS